MKVMAVLMGPFCQWMSGRLPFVECYLFSLVFDPACLITSPHLHGSREEPDNTQWIVNLQEQTYLYSYESMALYHITILYRNSNIKEKL